jgi:sugar/nucleoside kinase (ribokinase family)
VDLHMSMRPRALRLGDDARFRTLVGVGGIGTGIFLALEGDHLLGRNESRQARLLDVRDYCKLHIVAHYVAVLLGADPSGAPFHVVPVGRIGDDDAGSRLLEEMTAAGIDTLHVERTAGRPTLFSVCFQYPDGSGGNLTTADSAAAAIDRRDIDRALPSLTSAGDLGIALALPEVPLETRRHLLELGTAHRAFRVAAFTTSEIPEARAAGLLDLTDLLSVNEDEAAALAGRPFDPEDPEPSLERCIGALGAPDRDVRILVSAGRRGVFASAGERWDHCPTLTVPVASTAGAGDALLAGVLSALAVGVPFIEPGARRTAMQDRPLSSALDLGVLLAAFGVTSPHTIHPDANLGTLLAFADEMGVTFSGALRRAVETPTG